MSAKKLISIDQAIELIDERYQWDAIKNGRNVYSKSTIYNMISSKRLRRHGPRHCAMLEEEQVLKELCP